MSADRFAQLVPVDIKRCSGELFYSGREAFSQSSPVYLLGFNPGTDPSVHGMRTVEQNIEQMLYKRGAFYSLYLDESWNGRPIGRAPMQQRIRHLFQRTGLNLRTTPASNLIFVRSRDARSVEEQQESLINLCWPFHRSVISELKIRIVICMGKRTLVELQRCLGANDAIDKFVENNERRWESVVYKNSCNQFVVGLPHPSRVDWTRASSDPAPLVERTLVRAGLKAHQGD